MSNAEFYSLIKPGMKQELGSHTFTQEEIVEFASEFDPQPFHLSQEAAAKSNFGALCASGWHTLSVWMRLNILNGRKELIRLTGYEGPEPMFGPSPGVRDIKWTRPVFVGETIHYSSTVAAKRDSPRRPGWAIVMSHSTGFTQEGAQVVSMRGAVTIQIDD